MRIEHVAIWCKDLELMRKFYETHFSAISSDKYVNENTGFESYFLTFDSGARLELMHAKSVHGCSGDPPEQSGGLAHFAISVGSEALVDELTRNLADSGVAVVGGPRKTGDGYYESVVMDPEDNRIEITA